ncbi:MAG: hypothetical protein RQ826_03350 [Xanthomonadales bacterium]|nr:hypothetical protein [Xanthomonadales bacterium]
MNARSMCAAALALLLWLTAAAELAPETRWADPSRVRLDIEFPGDGYHANWELFRCHCGDLMVRSQLEAHGATEKGESVLVGGRALLSRGFDGEQSEAGASLDAPALMMQLVLLLLERAAPGGPAVVTAPMDVAVKDEINHIHLDTGDAAGGFLAPWAVRGQIAPAGESRRRFDLRFRFHAGPPGDMQQSAMRLSGVVDYADTDFPLAGSSSLADWNIDWRHPQDPAARVADFRTLDELRQAIRSHAD